MCYHNNLEHLEKAKTHFSGRELPWNEQFRTEKMVEDGCEQLRKSKAGVAEDNTYWGHRFFWELIYCSDTKQYKCRCHIFVPILFGSVARPVGPELEKQQYCTFR